MKIISCLLIISSFVFANVNVQMNLTVLKTEYAKASKACWSYNEKSLEALYAAQRNNLHSGIDAHSNLSIAYLERYRQCIQDTIMLKGE